MLHLIEIKFIVSTVGARKIVSTEIFPILGIRNCLLKSNKNRRNAAVQRRIIAIAIVFLKVCIQQLNSSNPYFAVNLTQLQTTSSS